MALLITPLCPKALKLSYASRHYSLLDYSTALQIRAKFYPAMINIWNLYYSQYYSLVQFVLLPVLLPRITFIYHNYDIYVSMTI
jgi:hypothetical protein